LNETFNKHDEKTEVRRLHLPKFNLTIVIYRRQEAKMTIQQHIDSILGKMKLLVRLPNMNRVTKAEIHFQLAKRLEKYRRKLETHENKNLTEILKENLGNDGENNDWIDDLVAKVVSGFDYAWEGTKNAVSKGWQKVKDVFGETESYRT